MSAYMGGEKNNGVDWGYFDRFEPMLEKYMPWRGEGETMASQIVTAVNKLVYKWYNDGDVFDNTRYLEGWANDLSSYANWLDNIADYERDCSDILKRVWRCRTHAEYESLLKDLADTLLDEEFLAEVNEKPKAGSIYECNGVFEFNERDDEDEDEDDYSIDYFDDDDEYY